MSTQARLADLLLRNAGQGGLWAWAMDERRTVDPPSWDVLAERLEKVTEGSVHVGGVQLRRWVRAAEAARDSEG